MSPDEPGPWRIMADPVNSGLHPYHDNRWIVTDDATVEFGASGNDWRLETGSLICMMRDVNPANARLISASPDLLDQLEKAIARENALIALLSTAYDRFTDNDMIPANNNLSIWLSQARVAMGTNWSEPARAAIAKAKAKGTP